MIIMMQPFSVHCLVQIIVIQLVTLAEVLLYHIMIVLSRWYYMVELTFYWSLFFSQFVDVKRKVIKNILKYALTEIVVRIFGKCSSITWPLLP